MKMIYPSIDKLLDIVDSKYQLVHLIAKRSQQMHETRQFQKKETDYKSKKYIGKALEELADNLIHIKE